MNALKTSSLCFVILLAAALAGSILHSAFALDVPVLEKQVEGPMILDAGGELHVMISIISGNDATTLRTLVDAVPSNFAAKDLPGICFIEGETAPGTISCNLGGMLLSKGGNITINYTLVAVSKSRRITLDSAVLNYELNGVPGASVSNDIMKEYAIGSPTLNITSLRLSVDGSDIHPPEGISNVLPGSVVNLSFSLTNAGSVMTPKGVFASIALPGHWIQLSPKGTKTTMFPALEGGASLPVVFSIKAPALAEFNDGTAAVTLSFGFGDDGGSTKSIAFNFSKTTPHITVHRTVETEWKVEMEDGTASAITAYPVLHVRHVLKNTGGASAKGVLFDHDEAGSIEILNETVPGMNLELPAGGSAVFEYYGIVPKGVESVLVPRTVVSFKDALGNDYAESRRVVLGEERAEINPTLWIRVFNATSIAYPLVPVAAVIVLALCIFGAWNAVVGGGGSGKNPYMALACIALGLVALLIVVSALNVAVF